MHRLFLGKTCVLENVKLCSTFLQNLQGLMFAKKLKKNEGILLDCREESVLHTAIHMLFVFQAIDAIWLDEKMRVVDIKRGLKPFTLFHKPKAKARYVLEVAESGQFKEGQQLRIS